MEHLGYRSPWSRKQSPNSELSGVVSGFVFRLGASGACDLCSLQQKTHAPALFTDAGDFCQLRSGFPVLAVFLLDGCGGSEFNGQGQ